MPTADVTYRRTTFTADTSSYGDVRYLDPADESRVLRTVPAETLRARTLANEKAAEAALKMLERGPQPQRRGKAMTFGNGRKKKVEAE